MENSLLDRYLSVPVRSIVQNALLLIGALATLVAMAGDITQGNAFLRKWLYESVHVVGALLHLVLIFLILFPGRMRFLNAEVEDERVRALLEVLNRFFLRTWTWVWVSLGLLYVVYLFTTLEFQHDKPVTWGVRQFRVRALTILLQDLFNMASSYFLWLAYLFLKPEFLREYVARIEHAHRAQRVGYAGASNGTGRATKERVFRRSNRWYTFLAVRNLTWFMVLFFIGITVLRYVGMTHLYYMDRYEVVCETLIGLVSALALGHISGLLDGRFILKWQWIVVVLFLYASMQTLTPALYGDDVVKKALFTYAAFTMKCLFFIFISDFFEGQRVVHYAHEVVRTRNTML